LAASLGASVLVAHPADLFTSEEDLASYLYGEQPAPHPPLIAGLEQVRAELDELQVSLALENINHWRDTLLTNQAEAMQRLADVMDCQVALDVRRCLDRPNLARWVELLAERIALLYVHDRVEGEEQHPPLEPAWGERVELLRQTAAQACVIKAHATPLAQGNIRASREYINRVWH
jgi:sugar phosphate isomerase/epimerase